MPGHLPTRRVPDPTGELLSAWMAASFAGAVIDSVPGRAAAADQAAATTAAALARYGVDLDDRKTRGILIAACDLLVRVASSHKSPDVHVVFGQMSSIQQACRHAARRSLA